ncbi:phage tail tube protein [Labrys wisconsinensis]|uniref:Phage tail tube protein n=1 Tax=Labrys wisconsinensis TaxID=425677 RepID=A0ABU0JH62_9HYPH|nr:hypothetical protein [Labrys wisconsinensis]MDQ0472816.1 hypothetical protein [Labrys wisconsinensis]
MPAQKFGGEMRIRLSTGELIVTRGTVNVDPSNIKTEAAANDDGSVYRTIESKPYGAEVNFEDRGLDLRALMLADVDVTLTEENTGVQHLWTDGGFHGDPKINRRNGEVTGLSIFSASYRRIGP